MTRGLPTRPGHTPHDDPFDPLVVRGGEKLDRGDVAGAYDDARSVLRQANKHGPAHFLMARIAARRGAFEDARKLGEIAVTLGGARADHLAHLAFCQLKLGRHTAAKDLAVRALALGDSGPEFQALLGAIFHALADYVRAAEALQAATRADPNNDMVLADLGLVRILCGDTTGARTALEQALRLNPRNVRAYGGLSEARAATPADNAIEEMASLIDSMEDPFRAIHLHHALARELESLGNYERSFGILTQGKERLSSAITVDEAADWAMYRQLTNFIDASAGVRGCDRGTRPIFVVGMPRSGTTVVERIMTNCGGVVSIGESGRFAELVKHACASRSPRFVDASEVEREWQRLDLVGLGHEYVCHGSAMTERSPCFLDKMPLNFLLAPLILRALPQARIVWLVRHPLDTVVGNFRQLFEFQSLTYVYSLNLQDCARYTAESMRLARAMVTRHPNQVRLVQYEELIRDPIATGRMLFEFCGLAWRDEYAQIERNQLPVGSASAMQVREPIHLRYAGRWRRYAARLDGAKAVFDRHAIDW